MGGIRTMALAMGLLVAANAWGGPIAEFNAGFDTSYGQYRSALFLTNAGKPAESARAQQAFQASWEALIARYGATPPPQFSEDPAWAATLHEVLQLTQRAGVQIGQGALPAAHETLERVRDVLSELRRRNGVVNYSDRVNAFHEHMEHVLTAFQAMSEAQLGTLREEGAVLAALNADLGTLAPSTLRSDPAFQAAIDDLSRAVEGVRAAARSGDVRMAAEALKRVKPAFGKMFVKFG